MAFITNFQSCVEIEDYFYRYYLDKMTNIDKIFEAAEDNYTEWTVDRFSSKGDTVYFMCAKTSIDHMRKIRKFIKENYRDKELILFTEEQFEMYKKYAGKIIAHGKVSSEPFKAASG